MQLNGMGSSVVIAFAAVLWLVYLIPTWHRRREYLSTERNAVRLQQTMRILAATAEVPEAVRAEATAREVAAQQRLRHQEEQRRREVLRARESMMSRDAARTLASLKPAVASELLLTSSAARRLKRTRAVTSAVLLASLGAVGAGFVLPGLLLPLVISGGVLAVLCVGMLVRLAAVGERRAARARELRARAEHERRMPAQPLFDAEPQTVPGWTPVPLPKPLYLSKPAPQPIVTEAAIAAERARILAEAEEQERIALEAERAEKVTPIRQQPEAPSRYARMGFVDDVPGTVTDLDEVFRRRRAV